ncbi:Tetratricopeptide repeat protein [Dirofilaria immitis]
MSRDKLTTISNAANREFYDGNFEKALTLYNEAIQLYPTNFILFSNRSAIFLRLKCFHKSLDDAKQSLILNPKWAKGYFRKGNALHGFGKFDEAIFAYCQSLAIENETETINALKNSLYYSSIKDHLSVLLNEIGSNDVNGVKLDSFLIISIIGQEYLTGGHITEAIALLQLALDMNEVNVVSSELKLSVFGAISFAYYQQKNYKQAIKYLEMQLDISMQLGELDKQLTIYNSIVRIALLNDETILAITYLRKQIDLIHSNGMKANDLQLNLSDLYIQLGEYQQAAQIIASIGPLTFQNILEIVKLSLAKKDIEVALAYCNKLAEISNTANEKFLATILKCKCLLFRKETIMALNILKNTIKHFQTDEMTMEITGQYFGILSECHLATGQYCTARKWAKKELKIATSNELPKLEADALKNLSNIYQAIGDYSNAAILLDKYCDMISNQGIDVRIGSLRKLAELYQKSNQLEKAEMTLLKNLKLAKRVGAYTLIIDVHADMYQFYRVMQRKDEAREHWDEAQQIYLENKIDKRQALIIEMTGDNYFNCGSYEEAIDAYNRCLMLVQEDDNLRKEAELCNKLGTTHWLLYHPDEALAYYQQSLSVYQQISDLESILELYSSMANIYFKKGMMEVCHSCLRCYLTLANILSKNAARLNAFIFIGRTLLLRQRYEEGKKIFIKALNLTSEINHRRERGLIYGYIAECYVGMNDKPKALFNFCKQIPFFDDINDIEGKCEMLRHLIEGKRLIKDANWIMQICKNRIELSHMGSIDLQIEVLKESAEIAESLAELWDACQFLEKAIILCIANKCSSILNLLLNLKSKYLKCNAQKRAIIVFRECLDAIEIYSHEQLSILFQLGKMELEEGLINDAIAHIMDVKERCQDKNLKTKCEYILACAYYDNRNYSDALYHMQNFENLQKNLTANQKEKLKLELLLIEWHCNASDYVIETIEDIAMKTDSLIIHRILDESCLYDLLNHEKLSKISAIHWMMTRGDFITAKHFFDLHKNIYQNTVEYIADMALFYWNEQNFEECAKFLEEYLSYYFEKDIVEEEYDELSLIRSYSRQRIILDFLHIILILCKYMLHVDAIEIITIAEIKFWRGCQNKKPFIEHNIPTVQTTRGYIQKLKKTLLYCLDVDRYKLIWYFEVGQTGKLYCFLNNIDTSKIPIFFAQFLDQMLFTANAISTLNKDEFGKLISESELVVNVKHAGDIKKTHLIALNEPKYEKNQKEPEIGILYAGIDSANILWEYVCPNDRTDFICKTRVSSLVIIDFTKVPFDVANIINSFSNNDIVILLNNEADDTIINFRIANARCLLDIKQQSVESLMPFLEKLINGYSVEECSELLQFINVRLFGDRSSKVRSSLAQHTRKMIIDNEDGLLENLTVSEDDQKEIDNFKELPPKIQLHLLNMIRHRVKTNEIQLFVEKLEDIYDHTKDITLLNCCEIDDHLQQLFVQETHNEQNFILKLIKHLFRDHLYGIYDDVQITKLDNLEELTKSLANNIRVTRKKKLRKLGTRGYYSEGESSHRSSISENTDSEAVVVDVEFQEPE